MRAEEQLSRVLASLYDRAATPEEWPSLLEGLAEYAGGEVGQLIIGDPAHLEEVRFAVTPNREASLLADFIQHHGRDDPRLPEIMRRTGQVTRDHEFEPPGFERSAIVNEFLDPFDVRRSMGSLVARDGGVIAVVGVLRSRRAGAFTADEARRFALLIPHLQRSFALQRRLGELAAVAEGLSAFASVVDTPVFLLDRSSRVVFANQAAEALAREACGVAILSGRLVCRGTREAEALAAAIAHAARARDGREALSRSHVVRLSRPGAAALRLLACPLGRAHPLAGLGGRRAEVALIALARTGPGDHSALFAAVFGLTPAEGRLASQLCAGLSLSEAADAQAVSRETVRSHLRSLLAKTDTHRQAELVLVLRNCLALHLKA